MTSEEAIKLLKGMQNKKVDYAEMVCAPAFAYGYQYVYPEPEDYAIEEAIKTLKEIQNYRKLGTLEDLARAKKYIDLSKMHGTIGEMIDKCAAYEEIGTVEECRKAMEKQKPKMPAYEGDGYDYNGKIIYDTWICPTCGRQYEIGYDDYEYCPKCGQCTDNEDSEETEDIVVERKRKK